MRRLVFTMLTLVLMSCAPHLTVVDQRGNPMPNERLLFTSTFGLTADLVFYRVVEESEESFSPETLPLEEKVWLSSNTKGVFLKLHVLNKFEDEIEVVKVVMTAGESKMHTIYKGDALNKVWILSAPSVRGQTVTIRVILKVQGRMVFLADGIYRIREEVGNDQG